MPSPQRPEPEPTVEECRVMILADLDDGKPSTLPPPDDPDAEIAELVALVEAAAARHNSRRRRRYLMH